MEGYFVRTLGMHRVYNSAFMHMIRDEDNAGYRKVIRDTLEFDPEILGRYVNFMTNPDEETAIEQFGTGDKYFGVGDAPRDAAGPADDRPRPDRGLHREVRDGVPAGPARRAAERGADRPLRRADRAAPPRAAAVRRARPTSGCTTSSADGGGVDRGRLRLLERARRRSVARRLPQPVRRRRPAGSATPSRSPGRQPDGLEDARPGHARARRSRSAADDDGWLAFRDGAVRARVPAVRSARCRSAACSSSSTPTAASSSTSLREVVSTADAPWAALAAELGGGGVPSLDDALATSGSRPSMTRWPRSSRPASIRRDRARRRRSSSGRRPAASPAATGRAAAVAADRSAVRAAVLLRRSTARRSTAAAGDAAPAAGLRRRRDPPDAGRDRAAAHPARRPRPGARSSPPGCAIRTSARSSGSTTGTARNGSSRERWNELARTWRPRSIEPAAPAGRHRRSARLRPRRRGRRLSGRIALSLRPSACEAPAVAPSRRRATRPGLATPQSRTSRRRSGIGGVPWARHASRCVAVDEARRLAVAADDPRLRHGVGAAPVAGRAARRRRPRAPGPRTPSSRRSTSRAGSTRGAPGRTSRGPAASSWNPPSTMSATASSSVMPAVWIPTSISAFVDRPEVVLPVGQEQRRVVGAVARVDHHLRHVDGPALGEDAAPEDRRAIDGQRLA